MVKNDKLERLSYLDWLRVFALFSVVVIHVVAQKWYAGEFDSFADFRTWNVLNIYDSFARWSVPIFVMISGALFLDKEIPIKVIYRKYILRIIVAFVGWSVVYAIMQGGGIKNICLNIIYGHYHMWFLPMIVGIYMCVPILQMIIKEEQVMKYFLVLSLIFAGFIPWLTLLLNNFGNGKANIIMDILNIKVSGLYMYICLGYVGYFICGYYFSKVTLNKKVCHFIYVGGILGFILTVGLTAILSDKMNKPVADFYEYLTINVLLESIAVFIFFKEHVRCESKLNGLVSKLSKYCFGAYLVHAMVLEQMNSRMGINVSLFNSVVISVPILSILVFVISIFISIILGRIAEGCNILIRRRYS